MIPILFPKPELLTWASSPYYTLGTHHRLHEFLRMTCQSGQDNYPSPITILSYFPIEGTSGHDSQDRLRSCLLYFYRKEASIDIEVPKMVAVLCSAKPTMIIKLSVEPSMLNSAIGRARPSRIRTLTENRKYAVLAYVRRGYKRMHHMLAVEEADIFPDFERWNR